MRISYLLVAKKKQFVLIDLFHQYRIIDDLFGHVNFFSGTRMCF